MTVRLPLGKTITDGPFPTTIKSHSSSTRPRPPA